MTRGKEIMQEAERMFPIDIQENLDEQSDMLLRQIGFKCGAKWADITMKNKIYEWLEKHARSYFDECDFYCFKCDRMIEGFKKAMEDDYE